MCFGQTNFDIADSAFSSHGNFIIYLGTILFDSFTLLNVEIENCLQISGIVHDLRDAKFPIDSAAEEAGKVVRELILKEIPTSDCINDLELEPIQLAALRLNITTPSALSKERMSIQRLLGKVPDHMVQKRCILK